MQAIIPYPDGLWFGGKEAVTAVILVVLVAAWTILGYWQFMPWPSLKR